MTYKIDFLEGASHPMYSLVLEIEPITVHKGSAKDTLLVEMLKSPLVDAAQVAKTAPDQPVTLFLSKAERNEAVYSYTKLGDDLPDNGSLLQLRTPTGLIPSDNPADYKPEGYKATLGIAELFPAGETRGVTAAEIAAVVGSPTPTGEPMKQ